ncbi:MAG: hypothetical protein HWN68_20990, partial [Desulfobacterales bacterium]|nr:hypothetical protein [Desulfobacterales bacterium]
MLTIGSDPEFGLIDEDGYQVLAHNVLPNSTTDEIGVDGHSDIGELRPKYANSPRGHLENIAALMMKVEEMVPSHIKIVAGSMVGNDPIGGHIHFGNLGRNFARGLALRALDCYLALPVALIEIESSARERHQDGYGGLGSVDDAACRSQPWGFEYRTLPSWLLGWGVALSILSIGYAVVDAVKRNSCPTIPSKIPDPKDFHNCNKEAMHPFLSKIRQGWRELPLYPEFRLEMAYLNHLLVHKMDWLEGVDIRDKWWMNRRPSAKGFKIIGNPNDANCIKIARLIE